MNAFSRFASGPSGDGKLSADKLTKMLVAAIIKNDAGAIASLVPMGADVNRSDEKGNSPLVIAATDPREYGALKALLAAKADPNLPGANGRLPLHSLLRMKDERIMQEGVGLLLEAKADPNKLESQAGAWPAAALHVAIIAGRSDKIIDMLLFAGADPCAGEDSGAGILAPLHLLARSGRYPLLETAFASGADVDRRDASGKTCLIWAAQEGMVKTVEALLERGADPTLKDRDGKDAAARALAVPVEEGRGEILRMLVRFSRDFTVRAEIRELRAGLDTLRRALDQLAGANDALKTVKNGGKT